MTDTKRTCANCCAFNLAPVDDEPACWNLVSFVIHHHDDRGPVTIKRQPLPGDACDEHLTNEEDRAQDDPQSEVAKHVADSSPEFLTAMNECLRLTDLHGMDHPETTKAMQLAMALAPDSLHDFMAAQAQELGLIPEADGYTDDGEPVFSLEAIAAKLDMSMEDAKAAMDAMLEDQAALGLPAALVDPATVHRKQ